MNGHDLKKIDEMFQHHIGILNENIQHKLDLVVEGHQVLAEKADNFQHKLDLVVEGHQVLREKADNFQRKLDLVVEGHQMLAEKINHVEVRLDKRMDGLERKICEVDVHLSKEIRGVAADLKEHRADTEAHKKIYKVKEE